MPQKPSPNAVPRHPGLSPAVTINWSPLSLWLASLLLSMNFSQHNIFGPIAGTEEYYLVNLLSGSADVLSPAKAREIIEGRYTDIDEYAAKGYLVDPAREERRFREKYADFLDARDKDEIQLFFV